MINLSDILDQKIAFLEKHLQSAIFERDHSATPMESHSDKSRQIAEQMIDSLNDEKKRLLSLKREIKNVLPVLFTLSTPVGDKQFSLVPKGLGGERTGDITLVSQDSPLGQKLTGSKVGDDIDLNGSTFRILNIR